MSNEQVYGNLICNTWKLFPNIFNAPLFCHYCVMNEGQGHQILKAYSDADFIIGLNNQYGPDFFLDNYATYFKNKLLLATENSP